MLDQAPPPATPRGRWRGRARVALALGVFGAVAVVVPLAPGWVEDSRPATTGAPSVVEVSTDCRTRTGGEIDHADFLLGEAAWARFCDVGGSYPRDLGSALVPDTVLTEDVATLVRGWQRAGPRSGACPRTPSATKFAVQVGFDDGTVSEVYGETSECPAFTRPGPSARVVAGGRVYRELMTALAVQADAAPTGTGRELDCPPVPARMPLTTTREPQTDLTGTGVARAVLCAYEPGGSDPTGVELRPTEAERVRALSLGAFAPEPRQTCPSDDAAPSYVVLVAGRDGATYEIGLSGPDCNGVRIDDQRLGSSPALASALADLAASAGAVGGP